MGYTHKVKRVGSFFMAVIMALSLVSTAFAGYTNLNPTDDKDAFTRSIVSYGGKYIWVLKDFVDQDEVDNSPYEVAINEMKEKAVALGREDASFHYSDPVKVKEMSTFIMRYFFGTGYSGGSLIRGNYYNGSITAGGTAITLSTASSLAKSRIGSWSYSDDTTLSRNIAIYLTALCIQRQSNLSLNMFSTTLGHWADETGGLSV